MTYLLAAALTAPLIGELKRWPGRLHAVNMEQVVEGWHRGTYLSACGLKGIRLEGVRLEEEILVVPWPPRLKGMPKGFIRCRDCWETTGKMRPRVDWVSSPKQETPDYGVASGASLRS